VKAQQADLAVRSEAVQAAKARLAEARETQTRFNATLAGTRAEKEELDGALHGSVRAVKEAELFQADEVAKHVSTLVPLAKQLSLDDSLLTALPSACAAAPDKRGSFDNMVVDQLRAHLDERLAMLTETLNGAAGTLAEHEAAAAAAQQGLDAASSAQQSTATTLVEAQSEQARAVDAVAAAELAVEAQAAERSAAAEARDREALALENFTGYNMECFSTLRDKVAHAAQAGA